MVTFNFQTQELPLKKILAIYLKLPWVVAARAVVVVVLVAALQAARQAIRQAARQALLLPPEDPPDPGLRVVLPPLLPLRQRLLNLVPPLRLLRSLARVPRLAIAHLALAQRRHLLGQPLVVLV